MSGSFYASPRWSTEIPDCAVPMSFDTYSACSFGCRYCFSNYQKTIGIGAKGARVYGVRPVHVDAVKRLFLGQETNVAHGQFHRYVDERRVMQWGGLADPFDHFEMKHGVGLEMLKFFALIDYPITFSTKGVAWTKDERYMEPFRKATQFHVKMSIITPEERYAKAIERGVPTVKERLKAMERLAKLGVPVTLRLRPFIPVVSAGYRKLMRSAADAGARSVSTEFYCIERRSKVGCEQAREIGKMVEYDLLDYYMKNSEGGGYLRLNRDAKLPRFEGLRSAAHDCGMTIHVSDAHGKDFGDSGCCCGIPESFPWCRGQGTQAVVWARDHGDVGWDIASLGNQYQQDFLWRKAEGYNQGKTENRAKYYEMTMRDYLRIKWNRPSDLKGPVIAYGGVLEPYSRDGDTLRYRYVGGQERGNGRT